MIKKSILTSLQTVHRIFKNFRFVFTALEARGQQQGWQRPVACGAKMFRFVGISLKGYEHEGSPVSVAAV